LGSKLTETILRPLMLLNDAKTIAIVPARAGSKGMPKKNFSLFAGKPLYMHAISQALRVCDLCIFSSDNPLALEAVANIERVLIHKRKKILCTDTSPIEKTLVNVICDFEITNKCMVLLQPTSPLRRDSQILEAIALFEKERYELVMGVTEVDNSVLKSGLVTGTGFTPVSTPQNCFSNRQSLPKVFKPNGSVFVFCASWLNENGGLASNKIGCIQMTNDCDIDIDDRNDFERASALFADRLKNQLDTK